MASVDRALWEERLTRYRILSALYEADLRFGPSYVAEETHSCNRSDLESRFGSLDRAIQDPEGKAAWEASIAAMSAVADWSYTKCCEPQYQAGVALVRTPAPDLAAVLTKMDVIKNDRLQNTDDDFPREEIFAIIEGELRVFGAEVGL